MLLEQNRAGPEGEPAVNQQTTARQLGLIRCHTCGKLAFDVGHDGYEEHCPRCHAHMRMRATNSLSRTWALLITAVILYVPANVLPIMTVTYFGAGEPDTIMSGIILLLQMGSYPIAAVIFIASILVPLLKMVALLILLLSVQSKWVLDDRQRTRMYRAVELVGRWSMLDIFVIALLVALVNFGSIAQIVSGPGATAFGSVVVLTMLAATTFDARLIWDKETTDD
jgi:paraquat-inducible protein A